MTNYENAERLRKLYILNGSKARKKKVNICKARPNWNGCDYCDVYGGCGCDCWEQTRKHNCCHCVEVER